MSAGRDLLHTPMSEVLALRPRCAKGHLLGSPLDEARRSIVTDVEHGRWAFFGVDPDGCGGRAASGAHRR